MTQHPGPPDDAVTPTGPDGLGLSDAPTQMGNGDPTPEPRAEHAWPGGLRRLADRYQLEEPIASGGAAIVWRAFDDVLSRSVAIKLLHPHLATDPTTVERFRLESINAARLTHPNVVAIYDTGQQADIVYLVMEFVDGPSLRDIVRKSGPLDPGVVAALGEQVAAALGEAHSQGVVHRDIKPANMLLTSDGVAKVTDFGIAKALSGNQATLTNPGTVVGTAAYVAPEQLEGKSVDARADVYALGVVLYECLTGQPAFQGDTPTATAAARLTQELLPPRQLRADVPRALDDIIVRSTRRDPELRFSDGTAMSTALAPLVRARPSDVTALLLESRDEGDDAHVADLSRIDTDGGDSSFGASVPSTRGEYGRRLAAAFLGGLLLALIAFFATQALREEPLAPAPMDDSETATVSRAGSFDPFGDADENGAQVSLASDGDLNTAWSTEAYRQPLSQTKPGVGIWFDLGGSVPIDQVVLDVLQRGASLEVYAADQLPDDNDGIVGWGEPVTTKDDIRSLDTVPVERAGRYWLLWLTELPELDTGQFQGSLAEVRFLRAAEGQ